VSLNLTCNNLALWQTPTQVTFMCLSYNPKTLKPDGGHVGVRRRYLQWVSLVFQDKFNAASKDPEEQRALEREYREHVEAMKALVRPIFSYI
jgi:hypothetical protein